MKESYKRLIKSAKAAMKNSYSPYSSFKVGAAVITGRGEIFSGTNIENSSYGLTICAERTALYKAVSEGKRKFKAIAVVSGKSGICYPCGACLQVMAEFSKDMEIILGGKNEKSKIFKLKELLPASFRLK